MIKVTVTLEENKPINIKVRGITTSAIEIQGAYGVAALVKTVFHEDGIVDLPDNIKEQIGIQASKMMENSSFKII